MNVNESHKRWRKMLTADISDILHDDHTHYDFLIEDDSTGAFPLENRGDISVVNYTHWVSRTDFLCFRGKKLIPKTIPCVPEC